MTNTNRKLLLTLSTLNFKYFNHFKYFRHSKYFSALTTLGTLSTLATLGTFLSCSKSSPTGPEAKRQRIEVTGDITEDTVWESGKDIKI